MNEQTPVEKFSDIEEVDLMRSMVLWMIFNEQSRKNEYEYKLSRWQILCLGEMKLQTYIQAGMTYEDIKKEYIKQGGEIE